MEWITFVTSCAFLLIVRVIYDVAVERIPKKDYFFLTSFLIAIALLRYLNYAVLFNVGSSLVIAGLFVHLFLIIRAISRLN